MTIISREAVRAAYDRAMELNPDHDEAVHTVAQALALPPEAVAECVEGVAA